VQTRIGIFYCAASLAGAFSGILAFGISKMDGVGGLAGWNWIFILVRDRWAKPCLVSDIC